MRAAFIFIGASPRPDIMDDVRRELDQRIVVGEYGIIDGFSMEEIRRLEPENDEDMLITKDAAGEEICLSGRKLKRLLEAKAADAARDGFDICILMCTGSFDGLHCELPFFTADEIFHAGIRKGVVGVILPKRKQIDSFSRVYVSLGADALFDCADPYGDAETVMEAGSRLKARGADAIYLDCMGYDGKVREQMEHVMKMYVYSPRKSIAEYLNNLLACEWRKERKSNEKE